MKFKLIYLICMILCVFITFSTVSATDLNGDLIYDDSNQIASISQSESSITNLNENNNIGIYREDKDCVDSMNGSSNLNQENNLEDISSLSSDLNSIGSDEKSLKSSLGSINSNSVSGNLDSLSDEFITENTVLKASSSSFNDLQTLINNARVGDTINLEGKTFIGNGTRIYINKTITINGGSSSNMATLDGKGLSPIFSIKTNNVHLLNCNFINGIGYAVYFNGNNSSIFNCNFWNNSASLYVSPKGTDFLLENSNFTDGFYNNGSNVYVKANSSTVRNCNFINNTVENYDNIMGFGGALQVGTSDNETNVGYVINCNFINNTVITNDNDTHAGALCFRPGIKVSNSNFINNYCNKIGGATTLHSDGELFNCTFINNSAGEFGGAISTGFKGNDISVNITNCTFINNSAPMGGAIQIKGHNVKVINSIFEGNKANETEGGAVFIVGNNALIINSTFKDNFAETFGAGILINGSDVSVLNSSFENNIADYGAAVYIIGPNANLFSSNFTNHNVKNGSVYIQGINTCIYDSNFVDNLGEAGAGLFIEGSNTTLILSNFSSNIANQKGGAVFIDGSNAKLILSNFLNNHAIPEDLDRDSGLGGAIYIKGDDNLIDSSIFNYNTARNGSAIYTDGLNMTLSNTNFDKNQAWSYILDSTVNPIVSYFNESDILINLTLIGGNNIANAIYNTASVNEIYFYNVSYVSSKGQKITGDEEIHPVDGAQNSKEGSLLYQDDREDNQLVNVIIYRDSQNDELESSLLSLNSFDREAISLNDIVLNKTFLTGILGDISFNLSDYIDDSLKKGKYVLYAEHLEDDYYKGIDESNEFEIIPIVDLAINIGSSRVNIDFNKTVKYTIKVNNCGPNDASGVNVSAIIPQGLIYSSSTPSIGTYDPENGIWNIGNLNASDNQTLIINVITNQTGMVDFPLNVSSIEDDSNLSNNFNNKTIRVLMADLAIEINASEDTVNFGDNVDWTITVKNNGPNNASKLVVSLDQFGDDLIYLNSSIDTFNQTSFKWEIPSLSVGDEIAIMISTKVNSSNKEISLSGNVSADTYDSIEYNNFASDLVNVLPLCDLITKVTASQNPANKDDVVDWIVEVSNDGPDDASNVIVSLSDLESLGTFLDTSDESFDKDDLKWVIGDLSSGKSVSLTLTTQIDSSNKTITLEGNASSDTFELNYENNYDDGSLAVNPLCDLIINLTVSNPTVNYGDDVNWHVVVSNDGPDDAFDVVVSLSDLESLGLIVLDSSQNSYDMDNFEWIIGNLSSGGNVSLNILTKTNKSNDNITVFANVETSSFELNEENNYDNDSLVVNPLCDLAITIIPENDPVTVGEIVNWIINITNIGPDNASDVSVFNSFPEGLDYIAHESNKGEMETNSDENGNIIDLIWKVGDLENNESAFLIISSKTLDEGTIWNNVSANSSTPDINESNNLDSAKTDVIPLQESANNDSDNNQTNPNDNSDNSEYYGDDYPWDGYDFLEDYGNYNNSSERDEDDSSNHKSGNSLIKKYKPIDISNKKTGNPLVLIILSIFALFSVKSRKN